MTQSNLRVVTVAATGADLTTVATLKAALGIDGTASDAALAYELTAASQQIAACIRQVLGVETLVETWREKTNILTLSKFPVVSIASIVEDDVTLTAGVDFETNTATGFVHRLDDDTRCDWLGTKTIVTYTAGYALPEGAPADLADACIRWVRDRWFKRDRDPALKQIDVDGVMSQTYWVDGQDADGIPNDVKTIIERHRRIVL